MSEQLHEEHRARMYERVQRDGLDSLAEHEALEYLLFLSIPRQDTNELAHRLIKHFGSLCAVMEAGEDELQKVKGVGPKSARLIVSVAAFGRYYARRKRKPQVSLESTENSIEYVKPLFFGLQNERFYIIVLDDQCKPLKDLFMAEGVPNRVTIDMRKLLRDVARTNGTCAILAHNHPTGLPLPSQKDIMTTLAVMRTLSQLGVPVLDHIIVAGEDACSMAQRGCMPEDEGGGILLSAASRG